ncbi:MAG: hypothetical protein ABGW63_00165, partial [Flavobacteriaceae bacterium]
ADLVKDSTLLKAARDTAQQILKQDPELKRPEHQIIKRTLMALRFDSNIWNFIS